MPYATNGSLLKRGLPSSVRKAPTARTPYSRIACNACSLATYGICACSSASSTSLSIGLSATDKPFGTATLSRAVEGTSCTATDRLSVCSSYTISAVSQAMPLMVTCSSSDPTGETPRNTIVQSRRSGTDSTTPSTGEISNRLPPDPVASPSLALSAMSARQSNVIIVAAMCARLAQDTIPSSSRNVKVPSVPGKPARAGPRDCEGR